VSGSSGILVDSTVKSRWAAGAEILITSHTSRWQDQQVRTITSISDSGTGKVLLQLNSAILPPTTTKQSPDYGVEVALLSRNFVFESGSDVNPLHGGHFWVLQTPGGRQFVQGVEFKGFGQQGVLGRYPVHFHFCGDVTGSVVSKNTIRQSQQRCVVVHGTNNLLVEENVAFDTKGHCFMLEDGIETGNKFILNLGALTNRVDVLIPNNAKETDNMPATFWATNPTNSWEGNVAAGSISTGYWFELQKRGSRASLFPNLNPTTDPMTLFKNNVAHSNGQVREMRSHHFCCN
jgi:hypothetical protein